MIHFAFGLPAAEPLAPFQQLRDDLLAGGVLSLPHLNQQIALLATRERRMGLGTTHRLFSYPRVALPGADELDRARSYPVPKPLDFAKAVLADACLQKHGIRIVPVPVPRQNEESTQCIARHLSIAPGEPVGFLLRAPSDYRDQEERDYEDHVIPLVIQARPEGGVDVVNLDSMGEVNPAYRHFAKRLDMAFSAALGAPLRRATVLSQRQADSHSCHTDAMQILKDALLAFRRSGLANFHDAVCRYQVPGVSDLNEPRFRLPSCLQKTTQRSHALLQDGVDFNVAVVPHGESLQTHRAKYTAAFRLPGSAGSDSCHKQANHFLTLKALRNADKVLTLLEGMPPSQRKRYLNALRMAW